MPAGQGLNGRLPAASAAARAPPGEAGLGAPGPAPAQCERVSERARSRGPEPGARARARRRAGAAPSAGARACWPAAWRLSARQPAAAAAFVQGAPRAGSRPLGGGGGRFRGVGAGFSSRAKGISLGGLQVAPGNPSLAAAAAALRPLHTPPPMAGLDRPGVGVPPLGANKAGSGSRHCALSSGPRGGCLG